MPKNIQSTKHDVVRQKASPDPIYFAMKLPTEKQSIRVVEILTKLNEEGCQLSLVYK